VPERKNVRAAIKAFEQAFDSTKDDVQFVVKVLNLDAHNDFSDYLLEEAASNQKIKLIDQYFDRDQVFSLLSRIDCFVSLHRSEGFGLGIAEAMLFGKPVIATDWSGNTDFCNAENSLPVNYELIKLDKNHGPYKKGQTWADPSASHAAAQMKLVFSDEKRARKIGLRAAADVKERLSPSFIGAMLHTRLSRIHQILIG
jgi:glycosyltransferase involved in cell wall biosynthesis